MDTDRPAITPERFRSGAHRQQSEGKESIAAPPTGFWSDAWSRLRKNTGALIGLSFIVLVVILAFLGPLLTPYNTTGQSIVDRFGSPSGQYWFGTDQFGRSLWDRVWVGTQVSLYIGLLATVVDLCIGVVYGSLSAYYGGKVDTVMQRIVEVLIGIPNLVVVILAMLILNPGILSITFAIALTGWTGTARLVRGQILRLKEQEFFLASISLGAGAVRLIGRHLIPNTLGIIIITLMFTVPSAIFFEAFLGFIGLGIRPPDASLGSLINQGASQIRYYPYLTLIPCTVLAVLMISFNLLGDGLRDALDPRMRR